MKNKIISVFRNFAKIFLRISEQDIKDEDLEYLLWICSLYLRIRDIPGHIVEVGVAGGRNAVLFGKLIRLFNHKATRQYIGFDTFNGYIERDLKIDAHLSPDRWKGITMSSVLARCNNAGVSDQVEFIQGDVTETVHETLVNYSGKKFQAGHARFALLYVDCNAYKPALFSMESFYEYMMPGGLIVIDEKIQGGETRALTEFASKKGLVVERLGENEVPMAITVPHC